MLKETTLTALLLLLSLGFAFSPHRAEAARAAKLETVNVGGAVTAVPSGGWLQRINLPPHAITFAVELRVLLDIPADRVTISLRDDAGPLPINGSSDLPMPRSSNGLPVLLPVVRVRSGYNLWLKINDKQQGLTAPVAAQSVLILNSQKSAPLTGVADEKPLIDSADYRAYGKSLARLALAGGGSCTAFAITAKYLLTNQHCVRHLTVPCEQMTIELNAVDKASAGNLAQCAGIAARDEGLDYALIELKSGAAVPPLPLFRGSVPTGPAVALATVHHPWGSIAKLTEAARAVELADANVPSANDFAASRKICKISSVTKFMAPPLTKFKTTFIHRLDTDPGSSGAPILYQKKVVGLHFDMDQRLYLSDWDYLSDARQFDCFKREAGLANWATPICYVIKDAAAKTSDLGIQALAKGCK